MKRILWLLPALFCFTFAYSSTTMDECSRLRVYFGLPHEKAGAAIAEYEKRLLADPSDHYADLALSVIYAGIASTLDGPDKSAVQPLIEHTERFLLTDSNNVYAISYNALGHGLRAKYSFNPFEQISEVNFSIRRIEQALLLARNKDSEIFVRLVRGSIYASLPAFFNKWDAALEDFKILEDAFATNKNLSGEMVLVYYYSGEIAYFRGNTGKAREYWKKTIDINNLLKMEFAEARLSQKRLSGTQELTGKETNN